VYSEFLKLKKSYLFTIAVLASAFVPTIAFVVSISNDYSGITNTLRYTLVKNYRANIEINCFEFLYTVLFSLIAGYIFSREFTDKTDNIIYSYPISRTKIFIGKLLTLYIIISFIYIVQFLAMYLSLCIAWRELPSKYFIITDMKVNLYSMLLEFLLMPIPILIGNITKNIIFPVIYGMLGAISCMGVMAAGLSYSAIYMQFSPLMLPIIPMYYFHAGDPIDFVLTTTSAVLTFSIFTFLSIYHYNKMDIN
jgi:bacitracin transport system permease protein